MNKLLEKGLQDGNGNTSALRIMVLCIVGVSALLILAGAIAMFLNKDVAGTAMTVGSGTAAASLGAKVWQKNLEK
jgi:hypothetical protein